MEEEQDNRRTTRNVSAKDIVAAIIVVILLIFIGWHKEAGDKWAALIFTAIPVFGLLYWLKIPSENRLQIEKNAKEETDRSKLGKGFKYFMWAVYLFVTVIFINTLIAWLQSA